MLAGRAKAQGTYEACVQKWLAKGYATECRGDFAGFSKCHVKYAAAWPKLQKLIGSTTCNQARFVDNGDGTVTDNLTGLVWEQQSQDSSVRDINATYSWSTGAPYAENGTAFTGLLTLLNTV